MDHQKAYIQFEEAFRGPRHEIQYRLSSYSDFLLKLKGDPLSKSLDLGCGRGEWLELCKKIGFGAQGVDINPHFAAQCNNLGLDAKCANIIDLLPLLEASSYALVSAFHLIEHLESNDMFKLLPEILRILEPSGFVMLETPSIDNLLVATKSFYIDPTHINPIHPEALCFFLKECGFAWAKVFYINGSSDKNNPCNHITRTFTAVAQDVCILASKGIPNKAMLAYLESGSIFNYAPTTLEALNAYEEYKSQTEQGILDKLTQTEQGILDKLTQTEQGILDKLIQTEQSIDLLNSMQQLQQQEYQARLADFQGLIDSIFNSRSWKLTKPLRDLTYLYRKLKKIPIEPKLVLLTTMILKKLEVYTFFKRFYFKFIKKTKLEQLNLPSRNSTDFDNIPKYMKSQLNERSLEILNDLNNISANTDSRKL